ncbi:hypothetical protein SAMD00019534_049180 [Acytostelium subglobosum LB1]|uniref:hypothetical protein n=1 Tax=Acytostelium subglobosum LB1 TaxID=1410327 RepID=UPI000644B59B|nr:hypothetical protein SAMD00019534_049180 [Acytostelium subglobosum LB1]GAM21743.1 hypothetical protein SAMD00019534_049180 [Acytostelium subglobosum LB1]|eukprot:XP_012754843.1 hypothetical protein SAMD00019534_049180 [Acytostelium subglobosum LB1]
MGLGIFPTATLINNNCAPNTYFYMDNYGMMVYRSNQDIKAGDEVTTNYLDPLQSLTRRREIFFKEFNMFCECSRCATMVNTENQCPTCSQALGKQNLRTWEPQPASDFDGQVYICDKGHTTMTMAYEMLEELSGYADQVGHLPHIEATMQKYFQSVGTVWLRYIRYEALSKVDNMLRLNSKTVETIERLPQMDDAALGINARYLVHGLYKEAYKYTMLLYLLKEKKKNGSSSPSQQ